MKKAVFLAVATLLASQFLFAQYPQNPSGRLSDNSLPDEIAAALPELPAADTLTDFGWAKATGETAVDFAYQSLSPEPDTVYHLEFEAEKGITLHGASLVDLINHDLCSTPDLTAFNRLNHNRVLVFINDQPTLIQETNVTAALRKIPAERIKAIDIRNAPTDISDPEEEANIIIRVTQLK